MEKYLIIVAGGKGTRLSADLPKQFIEINGKPLLMHTFDAFSETGYIDHFVLVLPTEYISYWNELCETFRFATKHIIREGGPKRYHSVKSGLAVVPENSLVAVHDAARPFVSKRMVREGFDLALRKGNAVPVINMEDSLREVSGTLNKPVNRNRFRRVQTPQFFRSNLLKNAYQQPYDERFTDDATVLELAGNQIFLFEGDPENIKITHPVDLVYAEHLFRIKI
ncbi:MAG: 2-C-methyl-D-erythritol 4-phosphate cytidylyltransferase [Bacteroidetes bacterium]|nr:MAG: 2-C-methyl-D-erythritol 4-phosphate cytidylyltransferase [Bacteroidota bacterium]RLD46737.1 MAG: 2-C-methyl-D-erythritol 4-phosphate cytidylyltransferase [Bacteroidota bacterium]RLD86136.1 MAG: 2-C-methyl-D-erythritol 4-phosphate cytidylyltransferase [Bacteroidota bacterium]